MDSTTCFLNDSERDRRTEGSRRILTVGDGYELAVERDGVPRVRDLDAAARLGFSRPRDIRKLIERVWPENKRPHVRATMARTSMPRGGERERVVDEYWLTEAEFLKLCARAETPIAEAVLDDMIARYMAARLHLAAPSLAPAPRAPAVPGRRVLTVEVDEATWEFLASRADRLALRRGTWSPSIAARHILDAARSLSLGLGIE